MIVIKQIHSITSKVDWTIFTPNPRLFSTKELYYIQKTASTFFTERIKTSQEFKHQQVVQVDFKLKDQAVEAGKVQSLLTAEVTMTYTGKVLDNFSDVVPFAVNNAEVQYLLRTLVQGGFFAPSSTSSSIKYSFDGKSSIISNSGLDKYKIIFIVLITMSGMLALTALLVLFTSNCCRCGQQRRRRKEQTDLKITKTEDSDDPDSPKGVLGACKQTDGKSTLTPQRGILQMVEDTPLSQSSHTGSVYSTTTSKAPLGILSMQNLNKMLVSPEKQSHSIALYNVGLDNDEESYYDEETVHDNSSTKEA